MCSAAARTTTPTSKKRPATSMDSLRPYFLQKVPAGSAAIIPATNRLDVNHCNDWLSKEQYGFLMKPQSTSVRSGLSRHFPKLFSWSARKTGESQHLKLAKHSPKGSWIIAEATGAQSQQLFYEEPCAGPQQDGHISICNQMHDERLKAFDDSVCARCLQREWGHPNKMMTP